MMIYLLENLALLIRLAVNVQHTQVQQLAVQLANPGTGLPGLSDAVTQISSVMLQIKLQLSVPNPSNLCPLH